jgi:ribonuclease BN (tRNA processing enzyme)
MIKLTFLGTKGEIEEFTEKHKYHASLLVTAGGTRLLIDYGKLRKYTLEELKPDAILITHAHPDPYAWLNEDIKTNIPVYMTQETYDYGKFKPANPHIFTPGDECDTGPFHWFAYRVIHSIRCPAVGYRITVEGKTFIYNPDLVDIVEKAGILTDIDCYIGDGSAIRANLVRRRDDQLVGHTRITTQINWCKNYGITNILFTHLGKETIEKEKAFQAEHPEITLAYDGMERER